MDKPKHVDYIQMQNLISGESSGSGWCSLALGDSQQASIGISLGC